MRCFVLVLFALSVVGLAQADPGGHVLLRHSNCVACHASDSVPMSGAPDLTQATSRIHPDYLQAFISAPQEVKPGTAMPDVLGHLPEAERRAVAKDIVEYLQSLGDGALFQLSPIDPEKAELGATLFNQVGCVQCHSDGFVRVDEKYSLTSLTSFLEDPLAVRPSGRMPDMQLTHWEAIELASYLLKDQKVERVLQLEPTRVERGKEWFSQYGCVQCHQPKEAKVDFAAPLAGLDLTSACGGAKFEHSKEELAQMAAAVKTPVGGGEAQIRLTMTELNCIACHQRGDLGGPSPELDQFFTTTNLNLGEQARIPPSLTGVGAKLESAWLRKVLVSGASARPYMNTRMPKFGRENVEPLIELFAQADELEELEIDRVNDKKTAREAGFELVGTKNLGCVACHTFNGKSATTLAGMELSDMTSRLQENWFHHYLRDPQKFHSSTIMPSFWPGGKPTRPEILDANTSQQINAIWQYLEQGREARTPEGINREPIEYGSSNGEAVMLRRQYKGIGKRGIGVGYPSGINLSFDAGQGRLGSIWKGGFGEMSGVWQGQGSGNVNERSREVVRFPVGSAFAILESVESAWPVVEEGKKVPEFQFMGYELDEKQRPTFLYRFGEIKITDRFVDQSDEAALVRTLTFDPVPDGSFYLRIAVDEGLKVVTPEGLNPAPTYELGSGLEVMLGTQPLAPGGKIREINGAKELIWAPRTKMIIIKYAFPETK